MRLLRPSIARYILCPAALYLMHIHINYYSEQSLNVFTETCSGKVIAPGTYPYGSRAGEADMAWCLALKV
jgi:hypothetical protein